MLRDTTENAALVWENWEDFNEEYMSRSRKKHSYSYCCDAKMNWWKREANRKVRRSMRDISNGNEYRKLEEIWSSPGDGPKVYFDPKHAQKMMRK